MADSYLDEGFLLDKKIGVNQPKRIENARILVANTPMDTDKVKVGLECKREMGVEKGENRVQIMWQGFPSSQEGK